MASKQPWEFKPALTEDRLNYQEAGVLPPVPHLHRAKRELFRFENIPAASAVNAADFSARLLADHR